MTTSSTRIAGVGLPHGLAARAGLWVQAIGAATALAAMGLDALGLGWGAASIVLYLVVAACIITRITASHPHEAFGPANAVTLFRAGLVALVAATLFAPAPRGDAALLIGGLAFLILALDGVDGWLARRTGLASTFGARFDLEIDALFVLVLSALAFTNDKAGVWVLLIGAMRYAFFFAGRLTPKLEAPLPDSMRRKAVCVIQIAALGLLLLPQVQPPHSIWIAAGALVLLAWSFAVDTLHLLRRPVDS
ncbi:MAG: CDP-alcohol phosphatidyltransferase family protein [Aliihoeflea sp.]|uniref:CDP-alcohol phosphatidyltransferase family protein n=1 Tax=Aliihoeflea sp. TaxID=2608088 RepID=UPI004033C267